MFSVIFYEQPLATQVLFTCSRCSWVGSELELDIYSSSFYLLVCCPCCQFNDIRVLNSGD